MAGRSLARRGGLVAVIALTAGCAPSHRETGEAVVIVWPAVLLLASLPQAVLIRLWRTHWPTLAVPTRALVAAVALASVAAIAMIAGVRAPWEWAPHALWLFGTSYLAVLLVLTRIVIATSWRAHAVIAAHAATSAIFIPFALALRAGYFDTAAIDSAAFYVMPGYGGWVPAAIALVLWIEWRVRRANATTGRV